MGSFPSHEEPVHPSSPDGGDSSRAFNPTPLGAQPRSRTTVLKKLTRGKLLVLGLDGAGKSTFVHHLLRLTSADGATNSISSQRSSQREANDGDSNVAVRHPDPTTAPKVSSYRLEGDRYLQLIDLPGRRELRGKWFASLTSGEANNSAANVLSAQAAHIAAANGGGHSHTLPIVGVVFVVDVSDRLRFPIVAAELVRFQKLRELNKTLFKTQFLLLLNKTDRLLPPQEQQSDAKTSMAQQLQRTALRDARRDLKKCVDYDLKMDQRRHPEAYASQRDALGARTTRRPSYSNLPGNPATSRDTTAGFGGGHSNHSTPQPACTVMNSVMECCAHDADGVGAVHSWLKDEVKKIL